MIILMICVFSVGAQIWFLNVIQLKVDTKSDKTREQELTHHLIQLMRTNETQIISPMKTVVIHHFRCSGESWCKEGHENIHKKMCRVMNKMVNIIDSENIIGKIDSDTKINWNLYNELKSKFDSHLRVREKTIIGKVWSLKNNTTFISGPFYLVNKMDKTKCDDSPGFDDVLTWVEKIKEYRLVDIGYLYFGSGYLNKFNHNCKWLIKHKWEPASSDYTTCTNVNSLIL